MTSDQLRVIINEVETDFSAQVCKQGSINDLDGVAIARFRELWQRKSTSLFIAALPPIQLLRDAELFLDDKPLYAALILLGTKEAVGRLLPQAEVVFEFRAEDDSIRHQQRVEFREGFLAYQERLWQLINLRNDVQQVQDGFFIQEVQTFNEVVVREALLNAVSHRDYRLQGSVFVRQFGRKLEISSPGGFPPGITRDNLLYKQFARNRRLAEALQKCGLIERSGQGVDTIYMRSLREGKTLPDYSGSDAHEVRLKLNGEIQDPRFLRFLEKIGSEVDLAVSTDDAILLDQINRNQPISEWLRPRLSRLYDCGIVERVGRGRGTKYLLSRRFYDSIGRPGAYTHRRGLDRLFMKGLLQTHLKQNGARGARLAEMQDVLPASSLNDIKRMLNELKGEGLITLVGRTNGARWYSTNAVDKN
jgi:ATP-dependent DNA helicase RecG